MGLCESAQTAEALRQTRDIERKLAVDGEKEAKVMKLLLLGLWVNLSFLFFHS